MNGWTFQQEEALQKLMRYCAYRDRCHQEVRTKLLELKVYGDVLEEIISKLIADNFLNEERYAKSYARGKFRINRWGRRKIKIGLKSKHISEYCIRKAFEEIDEEDYLETIDHLIQKRKFQTKANNEFELRNKIANYIINRGFESELVWTKLKAAKLKESSPE